MGNLGISGTPYFKGEAACGGGVFFTAKGGLRRKGRVAAPTVGTPQEYPPTPT